MAIATLDQYIASAKQIAPIVKTTSLTTTTTAWYSVFAQSGNPGAGTLAGTSTTTGVVPVAGSAGFPAINFSTGTGYITNVDFGNSVACRMQVWDLLWKGGAYAFNASTTGQTPTSYSGRIPGGVYVGTQIWIEFVTASTGTQSVAVTYTNQAGTASQTTGTVVTVAGKVGQMVQLPLAAGDTGVQGITGVVGSVATVGTFNILVMRPLWVGRVRIINDGDVHALDKTGMPQVFPTSALYLAVNTDSTSSGVPELQIEIANA